MHELTIMSEDRQFATALSSFFNKQKSIPIKARTMLKADSARQFLIMHFPEIVIIDAEFGNEGCFELIQECKRLNNPAKFIVVCKERNFDILQKALRLGAADFFVKPVDFSLILESAEKLIKESESRKGKNPHSIHDVRPRSDRMFSDLLSGRIKNPVELSLRLADAELNSNYINRPCALINIHINSFTSWLETCWDSGADRFYREVANAISGVSGKAQFILSRTFYSNIEFLCINNSQTPIEDVLKECIPFFSKRLMHTFGIYSEIHVTKVFSSLSEIMKYNLQEPFNTDVKSEEVVENALKYMRHNYFREITLDSVSKYVNLSKEYFCSYYKKNTGENFLDTLTRHRIEMSKKLLANTTLTIGQVAGSVGYKSASYFHKTFKKLYGISPSDFRKSALISGDNSED